MAEEKKGMFGAAKAKPAAKSKKDDKESVSVPGYEQRIKEYQEIGAQIADLEALYKGLNNELRDLGKEEFLKLYKRDNANPNTFLIKDGDGCFMFLPMDKYIGIDEARADKLKAEYGDIITKDEKYYFNGAVLERNMEIIETLLMGSPDITDADKENLIQKDVKYSIKKGTIDDLAKYGDKMSTVMDEIQIQFQVKTCGGKMAEGGDVEEEDIIYDTRADDYYFKNKNSDLEAAIAKWEAEEADKYMAGGGSVKRANNSPTLRYANFEDNWHINLLELNPYRNNQSGLRYKGGNKYAVTRVSPKSQEVFEFKTLEDAENKFNKLVELGKTFSPIRSEGKTPRYAKGSTVGFNPMGNSYLLYEGQSILLKTVPSPKESRFLDKEIVVEKIDNNKILKAFVRETGEKVPFFIDSNLFKIEQYAKGGSVNGLNSFQSLLKKYNG